MAIAEALSVGLPVVATDVGCVRAVVEPDVNGMTVRPAMHPRLATALLRLLTDRDQLAAPGHGRPGHHARAELEPCGRGHRRRLPHRPGHLTVRDSSRRCSTSPPTIRATQHRQRTEDRRAEEAPRAELDLRCGRTRPGRPWCPARVGTVGVPSAATQPAGPLLRDHDPARRPGGDRPRRGRRPRDARRCARCARGDRSAPGSEGRTASVPHASSR